MLGSAALTAHRIALSLIQVNVSRKLHTRPPQFELSRTPICVSTQGGGWQFATEGSIAGGETAEVAHSAASRDLGDASHARCRR
jgi:hypothetical protein